MHLLEHVQEPIRLALAGLVADPETYVAMVKPTQDAKHGDYQLNAAMSLAKTLGKKPREVAQEIVERLPLGDLLETPEIAGPGFINLRLRSDWMAARLREIARDPRLGVAPAAKAKTYVIDFSGPNVAKPMHVGHLRSTIIGDSLIRLLRFLGHTVVGDNHLGDWGTQFGMMLFGYKNYAQQKGMDKDPVRELARLYVLVREITKPVAAEEDDETSDKPTKFTDEAIQVAKIVADAARKETSKLHTFDEENLRLWNLFIPNCLEDLKPIYKRLDIQFDESLGESFYQPMLPSVVADLQAKGIARESQGAIAIFLDEKEPPSLIQKRDGAFTYTTTDLATIRHRIETWKPDAILYVVDSRQALHFRNVFETARRWGYDNVAFEHVSFGSVLGDDGRPLKTREGGVIELGSLIQEAVERAGTVYEEARQEALAAGEEVTPLEVGELEAIKEAVGIGAVKYADLCQNRTSDYRFSWQKMLAMTGNTGAYMQYAYVRNRGIFRKAGALVAKYRDDPPAVILAEPHERALAFQLLRLEEYLRVAAAEYQPNFVTSYLWDLSKAYSGFFQNCPVLRASSPEIRESRLLLCDLTARTIQKCLELLGIRTVERM